MGCANSVCSENLVLKYSSAVFDDQDGFHEESTEPCDAAPSGNDTQVSISPRTMPDQQMNSIFSAPDLDGQTCLHRANEGMLDEFYDVDKKKLSDGSYSSVSKCRSRSTGAVRAMKTIPKARLVNIQRFNHEIDIMKMMDHPNIAKMYETFEDNCNIYLIMEFCSGGELFDRIVETGHFTEVQVAIVMQQLLMGIFHLHEIKVIHRDLKTQNLLFSSRST